MRFQNNQKEALIVSTADYSMGSSTYFDRMDHIINKLQDDSDSEPEPQINEDPIDLFEDLSEDDGDFMKLLSGDVEDDRIHTNTDIAETLDGIQRVLNTI